MLARTVSVKSRAAGRVHAGPLTQGRDGARRRPRLRQRAERIGGDVRWPWFVPLPDASLGDGDGAARHPYQRQLRTPDGAGLQPFLLSWCETLGVAQGWYEAAPMALAEAAVHINFGMHRFRSGGGIRHCQPGLVLISLAA